MRDITKDMLKIYKPISNLDWMNYKLIPRQLTVHHIIKKEHGGRLEIPNLALLMPISHTYLHLIECKEKKIYIAINKMFKFINKQLREPTEEQRDEIEYLLQDFETKHKNETNSKGRKLIRTAYLRRNK